MTKRQQESTHQLQRWITDSHFISFSVFYEHKSKVLLYNNICIIGCMQHTFNSCFIFKFFIRINIPRILNLQNQTVLLIICFIFPLMCQQQLLTLVEASVAQWQDAGLVIQRSRVQILLPATRWICLRWHRIQILHAV